MRERISAAMLALVLLSVTGCSAIAVRLGWRVRLDTVPVTSVSASLVSRRGVSPVSALGPGESAGLVVVAATSDGKQFVTVGAGKGKVAFDNFTIEATVVQVSKSGRVSLTSDPRASDGKVGHLRISPTAHPEVVTEIDVPVRYDLAYVADFSGARGLDGSNGMDGADGMAGSDGSPASVDPTTGALGTQGPGGSGTNGGNGGNGGDGGDGGRGDNVHVWVRLEHGPKPLLQVKVSGTRRQSFFVVDPNGGSLKIVSNGGAGGDAGHGGRGGRGGAGGNGFPSGTRGLDGQSGMNGFPGSAGAAGTITFSVDPGAQPFMGCISWSNRGGNGGAGPPPQTTIEPVAALW